MTERVLYALGWALAHSLWQQGGLALALWLAHRQLAAWSSPRRYLLGCLAMAAAVALPLVTFALIFAQADAPPILPPPMVAATSSPAPAVDTAESTEVVPATAPNADGEFVAQAPLTAERLVGPTMQALLIIWMMGVAVLGSRFMGGWMYLQQMRWIGVVAPAEQWRRALEELAPRMGVFSPVWLYESRQVVVPTLVGWLRPVILLPIGMLTNLTPDQVEAVLAHELAHVRRHDYMVNLLQSLAEVFYFHSPGVWVISWMIREEREYCCDDLAVAATGNRLALGQALAHLERLRPRAPLSPALAASGGSLLARVRRIVVPAPTRPASPRSIIASAMGLVFVAVSLLPMVQLHAGITPDDAYVEATSPARHRYYLLGRKVTTLRADDISLKEACFRLYTQTGIEIDLPPEAQDQRVSVDFTDVSGDMICVSMFNLLEMDHAVDIDTGRVVARYWPGSGPRPGETVRLSLDFFHARQAMFQGLKHEVRWTAREQITLGEGLRRLNEFTGIKFALEQPAMGGLGVEAYLPSGTAREALHALLAQHNLEYRYLDDSRILILPAKASD